MNAKTLLSTSAVLGTLSLFATGLILTDANAQVGTGLQQHGTNFVDLNGDGYNDNAPDADGDGIPNGQDVDYVRPGTGGGNGRGGTGGNQHGNQFVDVNGDGYNDNAPDADGDGIPNGQDDDYVPAGQGMKAEHARQGTGGRQNNGLSTQKGVRTESGNKAQSSNGDQVQVRTKLRLRDGSGSGAAK